MPKWGLSMTEGKVGRWLVEEGAEVSPGVELVEIETDKILSSLEAPAPGILRRKIAREGDRVPVAGLLAVIADAAEPDSQIDVFVRDFQSDFVIEEGESEASGPVTEVTLLEGQSLRWLKRGQGGDAAILIHGFGGDINNWLFNHQDLAAACTVYALDLPGHGGSSKHVGRGDLSEFAQVLNGFMDALGLSKAHLVGHSLGGGVALEFALAHPDRVASLALIASAALGPEIDGEYINGFIASGRRKEIEPHIQKLFANPKLIDRQLIENVLKYKRLDGVELALRTIAANFCPGSRQAVVLRDRLAELSVPIIVIWGAEDRIIPPSHADNLPEKVRTEIFPGSGHMVQLEAHAKVNQVIRLFWEAPTGFRGQAT
jgi:pyruvate dehydrogenase E2 component (dihydrolipoamide acetyltransferase)